MYWFLKLLTSDLPDGAVLDAPELSVRGLFPLWAAVLLWLPVSAGVVVLYVLEKAKLSLGRRLSLAALRMALVGVLFFLILRPVLLLRYQFDQPRDVILLIDNSLSMTQRDQRGTLPDRMRVAIAENRLPLTTSLTGSLSQDDVPAGTSPDPRRTDLVQRVLEHPELRLVERLRQRGPLQVFTFGQRLRQQDAASPSIAADERQTALADAIREFLVRGEARVPAALVLVTDGHDNASKHSLASIAADCSRLGAPLHVYGVGTAEAGNLRLVDVGVPPRIFLDDAVAVPIRYSAHGFQSGTAELALTLGGKVVAQREVTLRPGQEFREVLTFTPRREDHRDEQLHLIASIKLKGPESFLEDNEVRRPVRLSDRKVRILYVENTPRWEYKFLMQTLLRDRRVEASVTLVQGDERAMRSGPPYVPTFPTARQDLFQYDLLIMGDVPLAYLTPERLEWIRDFVSEGGGLVQIAGRRHAPAEYAGTPLAELLPVEFVPKEATQLDAQAGQPFTPALTVAGARSEMLALADAPDENQIVWRGLEPIQWHYPVTKLRPGATALLVHPQGDIPLLASQPYGKGLVLFLGTDETWRWRYNTRDQHYARFWGQVAYQLGLPHLLGNVRRVQVDLEQSEITLGQAGHIFVRLLDSEYRPLSLPKLTARLEPLDKRADAGRAQLVTLQPVENHPGEYRALLAHAAPGKFVLKLDQPEPTSFEYEVKLPPSHELSVAGMAEDVLKSAATASGGHFYREEDLHRLPEAVEAKTARVSGRQDVLLWNPLMMLVFILLVTGEWLLRKMSNLS